MTTQEFIDFLSAEQQTALTAYRDEIVDAHALSLENLRDSLQGDLDDKDARIAELQSDAATTLTDHETALQDAEQKRLGDLASLRTAHEAQLTEIQGLPAPDSVKTISLQLALLAFESSPDEITQIIETVIPEQDENGVPLRAAALLRWSNLEGGVRRDHLLVAAVRAGLQWSEEKIDALFALAENFDLDADYVPSSEDLYTEPS